MRSREEINPSRCLSSPWTGYLPVVALALEGCGVLCTTQLSPVGVVVMYPIVFTTRASGIIIHESIFSVLESRRDLCGGIVCLLCLGGFFTDIPISSQPRGSGVNPFRGY